MAAVGGGLREAFERLDDQLPASLTMLTDDQLVGFAQAAESLLRQADALSVAVAHEFDNRTDETLGEDSLARKLGAKKPWGALETVTRTSAKDARARVLEGRRLAKLPVIETAVEQGVLARAQAEVIIDPLVSAADRADAAQLAAACENLIDLAAVLPATADAASAWAELLDPDGAVPDEQAAASKRYFRLGRAKDGLVKFSGALPVEQAAAIRAVLDSYVNPRATVHFTPDDTENGAPADTRSLDQQRADVLHAVFSAQARSAETPSMGGAHPTVLVRVAADALESGRGVARVDGEESPISAASARRIAESGGYQEVIIGPSGKILNLGDTQRCATPQQRRALAARDKGCVIPGCTMPARWCEIHHVVPARDGGPTDIDNLTLLCWFHHFTIDTGPYQIRMTDGVPEIRWVFGSHASPWVRAVHTPARDRAPAA